MYVPFSLYGEAWESLLGDDDEDVLVLSTKKGKTINIEERKEKNNQKQTAFQPSGRKPSPEGTRLLFAATISPPTIRPTDRPT